MIKYKKSTGRFIIFLLSILFLVNCWGCGIEKTSTKKIRDIKFNVIDASEIPKELMTAMEAKKKTGFKLTYADKENLYMAVGYGEQKTGGYSISVDECYLTENAVYFETTLTGPTKGEKINQVSSYPYIVVKAEYVDETVVFE